MSKILDMKTKTFFIISVFLSATFFANAQSKDSIKIDFYKKNELGFILNPVGIVLLGAEPIGKRIGVSYKHKTKFPNIFITSGLYYQGKRENFNQWNTLTLEVNGLLRNVQYDLENSHRIFTSFGAEHRWQINQCPNIVTYVGAELLFGYGIENINTGNQWMKADSSNIDFGTQNMAPVSEFKQTRRVDKTLISGGVQVNAGIQMHLGNRFYLFAQTAPTMLLTSVSSTSKNLILNSSTSYKATVFDFDIRAIVSDIGIFFKF
jgi:hypothetical protein